MLNIMYANCKCAFTTFLFCLSSIQCWAKWLTKILRTSCPQHKMHHSHFPSLFYFLSPSPSLVCALLSLINLPPPSTILSTIPSLPSLMSLLSLHLYLLSWPLLHCLFFLLARPPLQACAICQKHQAYLSRFNRHAVKCMMIGRDIN